MSYAYPNARVLALRSFMLKDEDMKALSVAKHLEEYVSLLDHTAYKNDMGKLTDLGIDKVEAMLLENLVRQSRLVLHIAPKGAGEFFESVLLIYEIEVLKLILNKFDDKNAKKVTDADFIPYMPVLSIAMRDFVKSVSEAKTKKEAVEMLKTSRYGFLSGLSDEEAKTPGYYAAMLDKYYYEQLWESINTLSGRDAEVARRLLGTEIDVVNILILLRSAVCGCKPNKFLIPVSYRKVNSPSQLAGKDMQEIVSQLGETYYKDAVAEGMKNYEKDKTLIRLELGLKRHILAEYRRAFRGSPFHIGIMLGFLKLKEYELMNLRAIAVSVKNGVNPKDIMELVIT